MWSLLFSPGSWCVQDFVCALQEWSLCFHQSCRSPVIKSQSAHFSCSVVSNSLRTHGSHWLSKSDSLWIPSPFAGFPVLLLDSQSFCWIPRLGSLTWGSEPSQQWENFFGIIVLQFVGCPPDGYGVWCHCDCTSPTISQFFFVFGHGVSFFDGFQHSPVDGCSIASCDFGALAGADECTFYHLEPIPSWDVFNKVSACFCASYMSSASKVFVKNLIGIFWHFTESVKRAKLVAQDYQKKNPY